MGRLADLVTPQNAIHEIGVLGVDLTPAIRDTAAGSAWRQRHRCRARRRRHTVFSTRAPGSGDVIYAINGKPVDGVERLKSALAALPQNAPFVLHVERGGTLLYLSFKVER